jgi:phage replication-related protein YjqB (UPF0714/DUF867 family)
MADTYADYADLAANETEGVDYQILSDTPTGATWASIAIHAGGIEPGSGEMARQVAGSDMAWYKFEGLKSSGNSVLHITATHFDEPTCVALVAAADRALSFHGYVGTAGVPETAVGGLDPLLTGAVKAALHRAGFAAGAAPYEIAGTDPANIVNTTTIGGGVQLEMSRAQREAFFPNGDYGATARAAGIFTDDFYRYAAAVRSALSYGATSAGAVNSSRYCLAPAPDADVDLVVSVATDTLASGNNEYAHLLARAADTSNWYSARLAFTTAQSVVLTIRKRISGSESAISSTVTTTLTHAAGARFALRFQVAGTTLRAKVWPEEGYEPIRWDAEVTDSDLSAAGSVGVRAILSSAYTGSLPVVYTWGGLRDITSPQAFTVTRATNGVAKALPNGSDVKLWRPGVRAL